jgi:F-type H+-transporting ATPase subunit b
VNALVSTFTNPADAHFWIFLALLVLIGVLWRARVHHMAVGALDDAGARVRAQLDEAQRLRDEAAQLLADIHARREASEKAAADLLQTAREDAERLRAEAADKLAEDIARREALAERKIAIAEAQAAAEVKAAAADMAAEAAEAILAARISGTRSDPLIDASLEGLETRFRA